MFVNVLILLVLIALTVALAYLFLRAIKARRVWVKIVGGLFAGLGTLLFGIIAITGGIGMSKLYAQVDPPTPANLQVEGTPEQIARGKYIVTIACAGCHSSDLENRDAPLTGGFDLGTEIPMPLGKLVASNIASDGQIKDYTDAQLFRSVRHGVRRDGTPLLFMGLIAIKEYNDDDVKSVIAYLRSQPPAQSDKQGGDDLTFLAAIMTGAGMLPSYMPGAETIAAIPQGNTPAHGKYVATLGDCRACHGTDMTGTAPSAVDPGAPNPRPYVATLSLDEFRQMLRTGVRPNGRELMMPWQNASHMTDDDLQALYTYLTAQP